jgi:hypothetical protein
LSISSSKRRIYRIFENVVQCEIHTQAEITIGERHLIIRLSSPTFAFFSLLSLLSLFSLLFSSIVGRTHLARASIESAKRLFFRHIRKSISIIFSLIFFCFNARRERIAQPLCIYPCVINQFAKKSHRSRPTNNNKMTKSSSSKKSTKLSFRRLNRRVMINILRKCVCVYERVNFPIAINNKPPPSFTCRGKGWMLLLSSWTLIVLCLYFRDNIEWQVWRAGFIDG